MDSIFKFKEAAQIMQQSEQCLAYDAARKAYDADDNLQAKIGEFNLCRLDLNNEMSKEERDNEKIAELNEQTSRLYAEIMESASMVALNEAKENIEKLINHVNAIINTAIEGGDPMAVEEPQEECGGSCGSCGGGCH